MADRVVTCAGKDVDGDIIRIGDREAYWSPKLKGDIIWDIESGTHTYFLEVSGERIDILVVGENGDKRLRSDPKKTAENILVNLPER